MQASSETQGQSVGPGEKARRKSVFKHGRNNFVAPFLPAWLTIPGSPKMDAGCSNATIYPFTARVLDGVLKGDCNFCVCGRNPTMWPFKWKLPACTFTWYFLFFKMLENEIWKSGRNLPLITFGSEKVKERRSGAKHVNRKWCFFPFNVCLDTTKFVLLSLNTLIETICPKHGAKTLPKSAKDHFWSTVVV